MQFKNCHMYFPENRIILAELFNKIQEIWEFFMIFIEILLVQKNLLTVRNLFIELVKWSSIRSPILFKWWTVTLNCIRGINLCIYVSLYLCIYVSMFIYYMSLYRPSRYLIFLYAVYIINVFFFSICVDLSMFPISVETVGQNGSHF